LGESGRPEHRADGCRNVIRARRSPALPDPVFILAGGPGQGATSLAEFVTEVLAPALEDRDIVLFDSRGTGMSSPLACRVYGSEGPLKRYFGDQFPAEAVERCRVELAANADLRQYTTEHAVSDLDRVRTELGYAAINLYGTSYGTRLALQYLRRHPERVRSLVLKGVVPVGEPMPHGHAPYSQRALERLTSDCEADSTCAAVFPNFRGDFNALRERLSRSPAPVVLHNRASAAEDTVPVGWDAVAGMILGMLQSPASTARLPLLIDRAAKGDLRDIAQGIFEYRRGAERSLSFGLHFSMMCTEAGIGDSASAARLAEGTFLGTTRYRQLAAACRRWPHGALPQDWLFPVVSEAPVLLISGRLDPVTPAELAQRTARSLPNSRHIVIENGSHSFNGMNGCVERIVGDFIRELDGGSLDVECARKIRRPPFVVQE
jgi:pimeloyl-ACP methyl ester carboxylesterase